MVIEMPLDFVADVRCFFGRDCASSKANLRMRSTPVRVITVCWVTNSRSVSGNIRPPTDEYSPSVFSRTTQKSMSPGFLPASGDGTPGISRTGRKLAYWSNSRRNVIRDFCRPAHGAEINRVMLADLLFPVVRHHLAVLFVVVVGSEIEMIEMHGNAVLFRRGLNDTQTFRHHLLADSVAGNDRDPVLFFFAAHREIPWFSPPSVALAL